MPKACQTTALSSPGAIVRSACLRHNFLSLHAASQGVSPQLRFTYLLAGSFLRDMQTDTAIPAETWRQAFPNKTTISATIFRCFLQGLHCDESCLRTLLQQDQQSEVHFLVYSIGKWIHLSVSRTIEPVKNLADIALNFDVFRRRYGCFTAGWYRKPVPPRLHCTDPYTEGRKARLPSILTRCAIDELVNNAAGAAIRLSIDAIYPLHHDPPAGLQALRLRQEAKLRSWVRAGLCGGLHALETHGFKDALSESLMAASSV
jgi:hypothetical protein